MAAMTASKKHDLKFIIFSCIGIFNTLFDLVLYVVIFDLTHSILIANIMATSAALIGSYILNSRITFKAKKWTAKSFVLFVVVTLVGLWGFQTELIYLLSPAINHVPEHFWHYLGVLENSVKTLTPKVLGVGVTFMWNFVWYNKVIFKKDSNHTEEAIKTAEM